MCFLKAKALHSKFSRIWRTCFLWLVDSWFSSVFFRFRIPHFRVARQQAGVTAQTTNARMNTNRQTKARIQPKRNKDTAESAENSYAIMLQDGKNKRLIVDLQSNISENCTLLTLLYTWRSYLASRTWYATQFHNIIVVPTIEYRRSKIKVLHTTQDIKVSIKSTLFENIPASLLHTLAEAIDSATSCLFSVETGFIM